MHFYTRKLLGHHLCLLAGLLSLAAMPVSAQTSSTYSAKPPLLSTNAIPKVMLVMSDDHELYKKAYTDYSDLDANGTLDTSYNDSFTYSGYFDSNFCYNYDATDQRFEPAADISAQGSGDHSCDGAVAGDWSGNFLNWSTMTRIDIVRTVLYGGLREVDTATNASTDGVTVLRRSFLPEDVHSFVKVFAGTTEAYTPYTKASISLCSTTYGAATNDPIIRVAYGSWRQWSASENVQCHYRTEANSGLNNQPSDTAADRPSVYDLDVRVQVCVNGMDASSSRCKAYNNSSTGLVTYKPVGLLQEYGDGGSMNFGLMTGSSNKKTAGGVLRKAILPLAGNTDATKNEVNLDNGLFINQGASDAGIINTLNRFKIVNWNYASNNYSDCNTHSISINTFKTSAAADRQCRNWGNPLSEIYLEAVRYFSGVNGASGAIPTSVFDTSDASQIPSLPQLNWTGTDPLSSTAPCATCSIIVLSTGLNSFDRDDLGTVTDIWDTAGSTRLTATKLKQLIDNIGSIENITGRNFLVGGNGTTNNGVCTSKTVTSLGDVQGLCPELPSLEGGYLMAGLAHHAHTKDLRSDLTGLQTVSTYTVALAESRPSFDLTVNGKTVTIVPTCQANTTGATKLNGTGWSECSVVDVSVESSSATSGSILVAWEDSLWGNDFDMDGIARLEWCIGSVTTSCPGQPSNLDLGAGYTWNTDFAWVTTGLNANSVQIRMSVPQAAAGNALRFGYVITGVANAATTTDLTTNAPSTVTSATPNTFVSGGTTKNMLRTTLGTGEQVFMLRQGGYTISRLGGNSGNRIVYVEPAVYTASASTTAGALLENPLFYTAKYGAFADQDNDLSPVYDDDDADTREWDNYDTEGNTGADGIPDSFFPVKDPSQLIVSLGQIFENLEARLSSGTAAAVVSNSSTGLGSIYQAYYHPDYTDSVGNKMTWGGVLHSLFIDGSGRLREDRGVKGKLEDPSIDYVVEIFYDETVSPKRTRYRRYLATSTSISLLEGGEAHDLEEFGSIWNARNVLSDITDFTHQRTVGGDGKFNEDAGTSRYIFTWLDALGTGAGSVDAGETVDFVPTNFNPASNTNHRYLDLTTTSEAQDLVDYIRGVEKSGWRNRTVDLPGDADDTQKTWVLGDIVHSSPAVVNPPNSRYDSLYGDETYDLFKTKYARRRQMIYVGGNDGMLHAFNGGVWDAANKTFRTRAFNTSTGNYDLGQAHELGAEMWAYVPMNLLPHLKWLKEPAYPHVYFVDGVPQTYDVNIFPNDSVHPGGWGTILVVTMRLGGGEITVDLDGDLTDETTMRSAVIVLDVTDPERPPTVITEIANTGMGFTTNTPTLVKARKAGGTGSFASPSMNQWLLVFGSGPTNLTDVTSSQTASVYAYDLVAKENVVVDSAAQVPVSDPNGFYGDFLAVDWNSDYADDVLYAGTVKGAAFVEGVSDAGGQLKRIVLDAEEANLGLSTGDAEMSDVLELMNQPIVAKPAVQKNTARNERWILFGTGRLFTAADNRSDSSQSIYGVKEPLDYDTSGVEVGDLVNSTNILVETDGNISDSFVGTQVTIEGEDLDTFDDLYDYMDDEKGWVKHLSYLGTGTPSERVLFSSVLYKTSLLITSYEPNIDQCVVEGFSKLHGLNFRTGTAEQHALLTQTNGVSAGSISLGIGLASGINVITTTETELDTDGQRNPGGAQVVAGTSTGGVPTKDLYDAPTTGGRMSWEKLDINF
jgi:type IV pilus assembly protein PilY1